MYRSKIIGSNGRPFGSAKIPRIVRKTAKSTGELRKKTFKRDNGICHSCGVDCKELPPIPRVPHCWEVAHIVDRQHGGSNELENVRTLCILCHKLETREKRNGGVTILYPGFRF